MKATKIILLVFLFVAIPISSQAQIWKKITKKARKKAEDKVLEKADKKIDKTLDEALEEKKSENVNIPSNFSFNKSLTLRVKTEKNEKLTFKYFLNNNDKMTCIKMDPSSMTGDSQIQGEFFVVVTESAITTLMDMGGMKVKRAVKNSPMNKYDYSDNIDKTTIVKTGNTKTILGFPCEEFIAKSEDASARIWATTSTFPLENVFVPILGMKSENQLVKGFVLEMDVESPKSGKANIKVIEINESDKLKINTAEYKSFGF
jgi:hypothetical protein